MTFPLFVGKHCPGAQLDGEWSFRLRLDPGVSLTAASVTVVDAANAPIGGTDLIVGNVAFALLDEDVWAVSFTLQGGTAGFYNLRCRYTTNTSPATGSDRTMRVRCEQT